jgi:hypothetical protein
MTVANEKNNSPPSIVINKRKQITDHFVYKTVSGKKTDNVFSTSQPSTPNRESSIKITQIYDNDYVNTEII